jgi:FMN hydrolase / 5-amino-6-(5-phospho-D-ribitylamino)uracil phosphatase
MGKLKRLYGISAISFDGDGTLWDFEHVMRHSLQCVLEELTQIDFETTSKISIEKMISIRNGVAEELKGKVTNLETVRLEAFRRTLQYIGKPNDALALHLNETYLKHRFEDIKLYDDVIATMDVLKKKFKLGLLSNGNSYPERCGLEGFFKFVVFSQDYGVEKPDPAIFSIALEKAECSKHQLLHVGDSLINDVQGATNAGITAVWLNRSSAINHTGTSLDYEISSLTELLEIV